MIPANPEFTEQPANLVVFSFAPSGKDPMMKTRLTIAPSIVAVGMATLATAALAVAVTIGAQGRGTALTADGRNGTFNFEVARRQEGDRAPSFRGRFRFEQRSNDHGPYVLVEMGAPKNLGVTAAGNVCEFSSAGSLTRLVNGRRVTMRGNVSGRVEDRRSASHPDGEPDTIRVRFSGERDLTFTFEGLVNSGDLSVFRR